MTDTNIGTSALFDCVGDPTAGLIEMFVGLVQFVSTKRYASGTVKVLPIR